MPGAAGELEEVALGELVRFLDDEQVEQSATGAGLAEVRVGGEGGGRGGDQVGVAGQPARQVVAR